MTAPPQIPRLSAVIGPVRDAIVQVRPSVEPHLDEGHWGDVVTGLGGQVQVSRQRLAKEAAASSLGSAAGGELTELARSEFDTIRLDAPTPAVGEVHLVRPVVHYRADTQPMPRDCTDLNSLLVLYDWLAAGPNNDFNGGLAAHAASVYDPATGLGAHVTVAPAPVWPSIGYPGIQPMSSVVTWLLAIGQTFAAHITGGGWHPTADTSAIDSIAAPYASAPASNWAAQSAGSRRSALAYMNAVKAAVVKHYGKDAPAGVVPASVVWSVAANGSAVPPILGSKYRTLADVSVLVGQATASVPIQATKTGLGGNLPVASSAPGYTLSAPDLLTHPTQNLNFGMTPIPSADVPLFDANLAPTAVYAAGGGLGQTDPTLRRASTARFTGRYGPTSGALVAGAYADGQAAGVVILEDTTTGSSYFYAADQSWSTSHAWRTGIEQDIRDTWLGAGCRLLQGSFVNTPVRLEATVVLRSAQYLSDVSAITAAIVAELAAYFDERPDWFTWRLGALQGVIAQADHRILSCSQVYVRNADGLVLAEPPAPVAGEYLTHWAFSEKALLPSYVAPV